MFLDLTNPWKNAVLFLILANVVFFCSPNLILFGSLFLIFFFSFKLLKKSFQDFSQAEIKTYRTNYAQKYAFINLEIERNFKEYALLISLPNTLSELYLAFKTPLKPYRCPSIPQNTNYTIIYLHKAHLLALGRLKWSLRLNHADPVRKMRFNDAAYKRFFS